MNILKTKIDWSAVFSLKNALMFFVLYASLYQLSFYGLCGGGLDQSWVYGLNWAIKNHLIFGKDIVFTFGPLAYLETHFTVNANQSVFIVFLVVYIFTMNYVAYGILSRYTEKVHQLLIAIILIFLFQAETNLSHLILPITLFFIYSYLEKQRKIYLLFVLAWSVIIFYVKLNSGIVTSVFFFFSLAYFLVTKRVSVSFFLILFAIYGALLYGLSLILNVDIPNYVVNALEVISGYNYAMASHYFPKTINLALINFIPLIIYVIVNRKKCFLDKDNLFKLILLCGCIYLAFKNGFVRADGHEMFFYQGYIFFMVLLLSFFEGKISMKTGGMLVLPFISFHILATLMPVTMSLRMNNVPSIYSNQSSFISENGTERRLPDSIIKRIGKSTVDIMPTEVIATHYNNLNYCPRPIFQSYTAYTPLLDSLNHQFFVGKKAPEYVIFNIGSIDFRHVFWDESCTKLALYKNYTPVDSTYLPNYTKVLGTSWATVRDSIDIVVLKRRENPLKINEKIVLDTIMHIDSTIYLKKSKNIQYLYADLQYTLLGKLQGFLYQPTLPILKLTYPDSTSNVVSVPATIIRGGVLINKRVQSNLEAYYIFAKEYQKLTDVTTFRFEGNDKFGLEKYIHIKIKEFTFN